jgi:hypothetical protein
MGSATIPLFLLYLDSIIEKGRKKDVLIAVGLVSYTLLTNMYSVIDLVIFVLPFITIRGWFFPPENQDLRDRIRKRTVRVLFLGVIGVAALVFWWYLPAMLPYGVSGYLMGSKSVPPSLSSSLFQLNPPDWMPATQLPITILGILGLIVHLLKRDRRGRPLIAWLIITIVSTYFFKIQSVRMLPLVSLSLVYLGAYFMDGFVDVIPRISHDLSELGKRDISTVVAVITFSVLLFSYLSIYSRYSTVDRNYINSDEYKTAMWFQENIENDYRVYVMYGIRYRGAQWLNTFSPDTMQVLGGNDIGPYMVDRTPFVFDDMVKNGDDSLELYNISTRFHVRYIVIDTTFMDTSSGTYEKFLDELYFESVDEINNQLKYARVYEVKNSSRVETIETEYNYWDVWRIYGVIGSALFLFIFIYLYKKTEV